MIERLLDGHLERPCPRCGAVASRLLCPKLDRPKDVPLYGTHDLIACITCRLRDHSPCPLIGA
jgi:hypothetical protein